MNFDSLKIDAAMLRDISLADAERIKGFVSGTPEADSCENSFATIYIWAQTYGLKLFSGDGFDVIYNMHDGRIHFPISQRRFSPDELYSLYKAFERGGLVGAQSHVYDIPPGWSEEFPDCEKYFSLRSEAGDFEYIYDVENLIESSGPKLRKKRNHIKHFLTECPDYRLEPISSENISDAFDFMRELSLEVGIKGEAEAMTRAQGAYDELGLDGCMLFCPKGNIVAAAVFSALTPKIYDVHFEKSYHDVPGAAQMMVVQEAVSIRALGGEFMNREQDMGIEGLRRAKESLDPIRMYKPFRADVKIL